MNTSQDLKINWKNVPTRTITAGGVEFAYRELGTDNPGTPVVFLVHLGARRNRRICQRFTNRCLSQTARVIAWFQARTRTIWRGVFRIATSSSIPIPDTVLCSSSTRTSCPRRSNSLHDK